MAKKLFVIALFLLVALVPMRGQVYANSIRAHNDAYTARFLQALSKSLPLHDEKYHFTITSVKPFDAKHYFQLNFVFDSGAFFEREKQFYLDFFFSRPEWSIDDLLMSSYDLQLYVSNGRHLANPGGAGALAIEIKNSDIVKEHSLRSIQAYVGQLSSQLPKSMGNGERYASIAFHRQLGLLNKVWEYDAAQWPQVRDYIKDKYEPIRTHLIEGMLLDTTNTVAWDVQKANVVVRNVYFDRQHTDSIEILIAPWMWEKVLDMWVEEQPTDEIAEYAVQLQQQCPYTIDSNTVLASCQYDKQHHILVHQYEVKELLMLMVENNPSAKEAIRTSVSRVIRNEDFRPIAELLVSSEVSLEFVYQTHTSKRGFSVLFTPAEMSEILAE